MLRVGGSAYTSVMGCGFIERPVEEAVLGQVTCLFVPLTEVPLSYRINFCYSENFCILCDT